MRCQICNACISQWGEHQCEEKMTDNQEPTFIKVPVYKWHFRFCKNDNMVYMKESAPNLFHRVMQKLILGITWKRIK